MNISTSIYRRVSSGWPAILALAALSAALIALDPVAARAQGSVTAKIDTTAPDHAFYVECPPDFQITVTNGSGSSWSGQVNINIEDMMTETSTTDRISASAAAGASATVDYKPEKLPYGVFKLTVNPAGAAAAQGAILGTGNMRDGTEPAGSAIVVANSPAKLAKDYPDDWPLGTHHSNPSPILQEPMPGFKWYRLFDSWHDMEPQRGKYDWSGMDGMMADMKRVGGRILLTLEGAPDWASSKGNGRAPDDMAAYREFIDAVLARYDFPGSPLGAIEVWNEYNANDRWMGTWAQLVEMHKITYEETRKTNGRVLTVGLTISPGNHVDYVDDLTELGVLNYMDVEAGHFYEEPYSPLMTNLRNNLPIHMELLRAAQYRQKIYLPIWDTETGVGWENSNGNPRPYGDRMISQNDLVKMLQANPSYDPKQPWLMWAAASERRMAATWVSATIEEMGFGVQKRFSFHPNWYAMDHALNLPWVSNGCLASVLEQVDYHYVEPIGINAIDGPSDIGALAYRIGKPGGKQVVVVWAVRMTTFSPHPAGWSNWIDPVKIQIPCAAGDVATVQDMCLRTSTQVTSQKFPGGDALQVQAGEEPIYIWNWQDRDQ